MEIVHTLPDHFLAFLVILKIIYEFNFVHTLMSFPVTTIILKVTRTVKLQQEYCGEKHADVSRPTRRLSIIRISTKRIS